MAKKFSDRLKDVCRCGHAYEQHDYMAAHTYKICKCCPCQSFHKQTYLTQDQADWAKENVAAHKDAYDVQSKTV